MFEGLITLGVATGFAHALQSGQAFREARATGSASWWARVGRWAGLAGLPGLILWLLVSVPLVVASLYLLMAGLWIALLRLVLPSPESSIYRERLEAPRAAVPTPPPTPRTPSARTAAAEPSATPPVGSTRPTVAPPPAPRTPSTHPAPGEVPAAATVEREVIERTVQLHCRFCGSQVSKPLRETLETVTHPSSPGYYAWFHRSDSEAGVLTLKRQDLSGSVLPLEHHPDRIGCCGFPGGSKPNIKCHGCGNWVLVDIEDCQAPRMTAARTKEVEIRPVSSGGGPVAEAGKR